MFLLAWGANGSRRGYSEHGTPLPLCAVGLLLAGAARRLLGIATALPRGSAQSRESLTQDSRSAVKARLVDPLRESFGEERCTPSRGDESLTQDSRNAVKARLIDPLRGSFGDGRCAHRGTPRDGLQEAITWFRALGHAEGRP